MAQTRPAVTYACDGEIAEHWLKRSDTEQFCHGPAHEHMPYGRGPATRKFEDEGDEPVFLCDDPACAADFGTSTFTALDPHEGECGHCGGRIRRQEE